MHHPKAENRAVEFMKLSLVRHKAHRKGTLQADMILQKMIYYCKIKVALIALKCKIMQHYHESRNKIIYIIV